MICHVLKLKNQFRQLQVSRKYDISNNLKLKSIRFFATVFSGAPCFIQKNLKPSFDKILIANRGEIACRIIKTARKLGIKTVAVYSEADLNAMHVEMADESYLIGGPKALESYLVSERIIETALNSKAQAIHPGYGFLSENADFASKCDIAGVSQIGPPSAAIKAMGSKRASKEIMEKANVPVVPGYHGSNQDEAFLQSKADEIGYPLMVKAVLGGGGKGMRIVNSSKEFIGQLRSAKAEALSSFSDDRIILERYIAHSRHIEFQIFADKHGNAVHLLERDCSVQRRNQKILEEAPAPGMTPELRSKMGKTAIAAAHAVGYIGAGTVEFIFDIETNQYYFMEMNTRLQVEHPVTEMITRRDLVQQQLHVAAGHKLPCTQKEINCSGHSVEARIYAETPSKNFLPCSGSLKYVSTPKETEFCRVETGVRQGDEVSVYYDPMIAKLVVWGKNREIALERISDNLNEYKIVGLPTNIEFLKRAVKNKDFQKGEVSTSFIKENYNQLFDLYKAEKVVIEPDFVIIAVMKILLNELHKATKNDLSSCLTSPQNKPDCFRMILPCKRKIRLGYESDSMLEKNDSLNNIDVDIEYLQRHSELNFEKNTSNNLVVRKCKLEFMDQSFIVDAQADENDHSFLNCRIGNKLIKSTSIFDEGIITVYCNGDKAQFKKKVSCDIEFNDDDHKEDKISQKDVMSPMPGRIVEVNAVKGDSVNSETVLVVLEAMKMRHEITAGFDGFVVDIDCRPGDIVEADSLLVKLTKNNEELHRKT